MRHKIAVAAAAATLICMPASAATVLVDPSCSLTTGCLFNGNITASPSGGNGYKATEAAYNLAKEPDIKLTAIGEIEQGFEVIFDGKPVGSITGGIGSLSGTWSLPGFRVDYLAVKSSNQFMVYSVNGSSGDWSTAGLLNRRGNPQEASHLIFFGSAVPEPATWALMIGGFGLAGASVRRRRPDVVFA